MLQQSELIAQKVSDALNQLLDAVCDSEDPTFCDEQVDFLRGEIDAILDGINKDPLMRR